MRNRNRSGRLEVALRSRLTSGKGNLSGLMFFQQANIDRLFGFSAMWSFVVKHETGLWCPVPGVLLAGQ